MSNTAQTPAKSNTSAPAVPPASVSAVNPALLALGAGIKALLLTPGLTVALVVGYVLALALDLCKGAKPARLVQGEDEPDADFLARVTARASAGNPALLALRDAIQQGLSHTIAVCPATKGGGRPTSESKQAQEREGNPAFFVNYAAIDGQSVVPDIDRPLNAAPSKADIAKIEAALKGANGVASVAHNTNPTLASAAVFLRVKTGKGNLTALPMPEGKTHAEKA